MEHRPDGSVILRRREGVTPEESIRAAMARLASIPVDGRALGAVIREAKLEVLRDARLRALTLADVLEANGERSADDYLLGGAAELRKFAAELERMEKEAGRR